MFGWKFENSVIGDMVVEICSRSECSLEGGDWKYGVLEGDGGQTIVSLPYRCGLWRKFQKCWKCVMGTYHLVWVLGT